VTQNANSPAHAPTVARTRLASSDGASDRGLPSAPSESHSLLSVTAGAGRHPRRPAPAGARGQDPAISIKLSKVQVDQVMRSASGENGHLSAMLYGLDAAPEKMTASLDADEHHHLSRSLLAGLLLLASFPHDGGYLGNAEVARLIGMNASTAHCYISTLVEVGLLERDPSTRQYRLAQ
jgi:hypothetical protein